MDFSCTNLSIAASSSCKLAHLGSLTRYLPRCCCILLLMTLLLPHPVACLGVFALAIVFLRAHTHKKCGKKQPITCGIEYAISVLTCFIFRCHRSVTNKQFSFATFFLLPPFSVYAFLLVSALLLIDKIFGSRCCIQPS